MSDPSVHSRMRSGPYFDDLEVGFVERGAPGLTLTEGHAAAHQAVLADRLRLALDGPLARRVLGGDRLLAHPSLVCDVAIGQSTSLTQRVIANLFYRGLVLRRAPVLGDTLRTTTEVVALKQNRGPRWSTVSWRSRPVPVSDGSSIRTTSSITA